jgi:hypothetical protein
MGIAMSHTRWNVVRLIDRHRRKLPKLLMFVVGLCISFIVLSAIVDQGAVTHGDVTGIVTGVEAGAFVEIDRVRRIPIDAQTLIEADIKRDIPPSLVVGSKVRIWYISNAADRTTACRVLVLEQK